MTVHITGDAELKRKLAKLKDFSGLPPILEQAAKDVQLVAKEYPPKRPLKVSQYWTPKQRRWFFANLRAGTITVPYKRTDVLKDKWTVKGSNKGLTWTVGNNTPYGPLVMGPGEQVEYHSGNWKTTEDIANEEKDNVLAKVKAYIDRLLAG